MFRYSHKHLDWLRDNYPQMRRKELSVAFNKHFGLDRSFNSVVSCLRNHKIRSGRAGFFVKGQKPWNKGTKGLMGRHGRTKPLYAERVNSKGHIEIKIPERNKYTDCPTRWQAKHIWLWEKKHGKIPSGSVVIFKDGDKANFSDGNLILVTLQELLILNLHDYNNQPVELKESIMALAKLQARAGFRLQPGRRKTK